MAIEAQPKVEGLTKRAVAGTAWSTLATVGRQVLTFASIATVARMLGPSAYGVMGMATIVTAFINNFRDLGTATAIVQKPAVSRSLLSSLFWINSGLGLAMCVVVSVVAPIAARFFHTPELTAILRVLSLSFLLASGGIVHSALVYREMSFRAMAVVDLASGLLTYFVALTCASLNLGVWSLVYASLTGSLVSTTGYWIASAFRPGLQFSTSEVRSIAKFSSNLSAFGFVNYACRNADNLIVGKMLGSVALGFYQMAYNMMLTPLQNISSVIAQVLFPAFSRIQDDDQRFRDAYLRGCLLIGLVTFPVMAGMAVVADPLVRAVLGPKWLGTIPIFQILAPVGLAQSVQTTTGIIYQAKGRTDWMFWWSLYVLVTTIPAFLLGVRFGTFGVALAYALVYFALLLYPGFAIAFRLIGLKPGDFFRAMLPQLLITAGMTAACSGWLATLTFFHVVNAWTRLASTCSLGAVLYAGTLLLARPRVMTYLEDVMAASEHHWAVRGLSLLQRLRSRS